MLVKTSILVGSLAAGAMANPLINVPGRDGNFCGVPALSDKQRDADRKAMANVPEDFVAADIVVPAYFHVVAENKTESGGYLSVSLPFFIFSIYCINSNKSSSVKP